jgi:alkylation response protein AidB-like acyl-CoA dehydrogenase
MTSQLPDDDQEQIILDTVDRFLRSEVKPYVHQLDKDDEYPTEIVEKMKDMGLFGLLIDPEYGGLGLSTRVYARIIERMSAVWMSISG